ncbi:hypothetical protein PSE10A_19300 [Pseudomonas amygdali pv. eriobotryae]|uniref:Uncharacterized protein n=1 Tax=Pseudomonas amygdali pv. eriobotryae TaxID=129137 RepID=A0A9P3EBX4_PSEA0|nr:hypothetical protein [Pseudomonas amygdali]GFZ59419.1 hypothetical protein PSE10A_19300 [Pseudomonas amygdali pv. eriobotryae]
MNLYTNHNAFIQAVAEGDSKSVLIEHAEQPIDKLALAGMQSLVRSIKKTSYDFRIVLLGKLTESNLTSKYIYAHHSNIPDENNEMTLHIEEFRCDLKNGNVVANKGRLHTEHDEFTLKINNIECCISYLYYMYEYLKFSSDHTFIEFLNSPHLEEAYEITNLLDY